MDRLAHKRVLEAAVIGVPDEDGLVKPEAFVPVEPGVLAGEEPAPGHARTMLVPFQMSALVCLPRRSGENRRRDPTLQAARGGCAARTDHTICSSLIGLALDSAPTARARRRCDGGWRRDRTAFADALEADLRNRG